MEELGSEIKDDILKLIMKKRLLSTKNRKCPDEHGDVWLVTKNG